MPRPGEPARVQQQLKVSQNGGRPVRARQDPVDEIRARQMQRFLGYSLALIFEQSLGLLAENFFNLSNAHDASRNNPGDPF